MRTYPYTINYTYSIVYKLNINNYFCKIMMGVVIPISLIAVVCLNFAVMKCAENRDKNRVQ